MEIKHQDSGLSKSTKGLLQLLNLRPEESGRTLLMLGFYTATCVGLTWSEASTAALFLGRYGAELLPWIYIASAVMGSILGFLYSWLEKWLPLRWLIVAIALLMAIPLCLLRFGLDIIYVAGVTIFLLRLWVEACHVLNELNTSITANQLFNIREIKRTYPLVGSGILMADVISGFSLPLLLVVFKLNNVVLVSSVMMSLGAGILFYITLSYQQFFPDSPQGSMEDENREFTRQGLAGPIGQYVIPLILLFVFAQAILQVVEFQFLGQLEIKLSSEQIAGFLGLFSGILGIAELAVQWFISSRAIEKLGVFVAASLLPGLIGLSGIIFMGGIVDLYWGAIAMKFIDDLFRYTLVAGTGPALFQPIPESGRNRAQAIRGIAEPISTGLTGLAMLATIWVCEWAQVERVVQDKIFLLESVIIALGWLVAIAALRSGYVKLLVTSAEKGRLGVSDVDLRALKRKVAETLQQPGADEDKSSCIELLSQLDPENLNEVLIPLLPSMSPALQRQSLEVLLEHPKEADLNKVRMLTSQALQPEVLAVALRYVWLTEPDPDIRQLRPYLQPEVDPIVRATAASLMLRRGSPRQKAEATNTLRRMVTSPQERERVMGCRALGEAVYMQALRLYIPNLLADESLRVRCALLEAIAATHLEEYYPSLLRGLTYQSTREAALRSLVRLENEAIPLLLELATDIHKPDLVRQYAWTGIGRIDTPEALQVLANNLMTSWGTTRRNIGRILLKMPSDRGIEGVLEQVGRSGIELLIDQELMFLGQIYGAMVDMRPELVQGREADLLRQALKDLQGDARDRCFLLMKFLYPISGVQAAAFNLQSASMMNRARGLEILDNILDIKSKNAVLTVLDQYSDTEKLEGLSTLVYYQPQGPSDRLRHLLELRHFLSDWPLACCFHCARMARWSLTAEQTLTCLRHPMGFVREAVLAYLKVASPRSLVDLLPMMKNDPNSLVRSQVSEMMQELGIVPEQSNTAPGTITDSFPKSGGIAGLEPI